MTINSYSVETIEPQKRPAIWAVSGNSIYPVCYLRKPKWMTEEQFDRVVKAVRFEASPDILETNNEPNNPRTQKHPSPTDPPRPRSVAGEG